MATKHDFHKMVIGRSEELHFIDLGLLSVPAKIDTGAYRSAIHASDIVLDERTNTLSFNLLAGHPVCGTMGKPIETKDFRQVVVENSFGQGESRYEVRLKVKLGSKIFTSQFTLANRSKKVYPILLGRKLLNYRFLVDTSSSSLNRVELKKRYNIDFPKDEDDGREELDSVAVTRERSA